MAEKYPKIGKNILRLRKGEKLLFWILHKIIEIIVSSFNVRQSNIAFSVVHVQVCFKYILLIIILLSQLPARVLANSIKCICASVYTRGKLQPHTQY